MARNPVSGLPILAAAYAAIMPAHGAIGQVALERPADAAGYPRNRSAKLTVVQSNGSFSVREKPEPPAPAPELPAIRIGNSLTLDGRLFARTSLDRPEADHVSQR